MRVTLLGVPVLACVVIAAAPARASDIIDEWGTAKVPPKPELKAVTLDPKTTAVLLLDLGKGTCAMRPRCVASVPNAPKDGEWANTRGPDKFLGSDLEARLKAKSIQTVIVCGTSAQGVVIGTGSGSTQRGLKVIVPVDCMSSEDPYMEQYAAWHMYKGGPNVVTANTTLTRSTMIKF
jgi:hypothetical protein